MPDRSACEEKVLVPRPQPLNEAIQELGHTVVPCPGLPGNFQCSQCGFTWPRTQRARVLQFGPCRGEYVWEHGIPTQLDRPWILTPGSAFIWQGRRFHGSHAFTYYRGVIFCRLCGGFSARGPAPSLGVSCKMRPTSTRTARRLKALQQGTSVPGGWPKPPDHQCPNGLIPFLEG